MVIVKRLSVMASKYLVLLLALLVTLCPVVWAWRI